MNRAHLLALSLLAILVASPARAGGCNAVCRADVALCMRTQCEGLGAAACRRRCRRAPIRTLAYVLSECRVDAAGFVGHQSLRIRRGDREPVTVVEFSALIPVPDPLGLCRLYGDSRVGPASAVATPLQRLGVSPDGSQVVFEVTDDFSFFPFTNVPPEAEGMFLVGADGRGLRRIGPASREPSFRIAPSPSGDGFDVNVGDLVPFSPDRRRIAFTDLGPGPAGEEAVQIVVLDLATGRRTQLTRLPAGSSPSTLFPVTFGPRFVDRDTVLFSTFTDPEGPNPDGDLLAFTVGIDGTGLERVPEPVAAPGPRVVPIFQTTNLGTNLVDLNLPGTAVNPYPGSERISEVFLIDGRNLLQLTNFQRVDTSSAFLGADRRRAFFSASADPLGTNPSGNCQLFSIGTLGAHLRQLTRFDEPAADTAQCTGTFPPGCAVRESLQDPVTRSIVFYSTCNPFGTTPHGGQIYAMRPDGSGLRQLTAARGFAVAADGTITAELPGPFAYSTVFR